MEATAVAAVTAAASSCPTVPVRLAALAVTEVLPERSVMAEQVAMAASEQQVALGLLAS
jgi:hypothetical protein